MLLVLRSPSLCSSCLSCFTTLRRSTRPFRILHGPLRNEATLAEPAPAKPRKSSGTKTKKSFVDLPKTWVNPDGTSAAPLGPWLGGLESLSHAIETRTAIPSITAHGTAETHNSDEGVDSKSIDSPAEILETAPPKKRGRKPKAALLAESEGETAPDADTPKKRTRKPKAALLAEPEGESTPEAATPKKRGRKAKAALEVGSEGEAASEAATDSKPRTRARKASQKTVVAEEEKPVGTAPEPPMTPLAKEVLDNLAKFPHCILLTRVGQFYESYFGQAAEVARLLNIKLTSKRWGGERVPMCGFPLMHLNKYLKVLVQDNNRFVAMCEEFMRSRVLGPKAGFARRVTRIVTPGTLIDEPFLNQYENNYLLSVSAPSSASEKGQETPEDSVGLAWIDVSTGEFFAKSVTTATLRDELVRISPREVVLEAALSNDPSHPVRQIVWEEQYFTSFIAPPVQRQEGQLLVDGVRSDDLTSQLDQPPPAFLLALTEEESKAVQLLTAFLHANLLEHMPRLPRPSREATSGRMQIDAHTIKSLEIRTSIREGGTAGSLLSVIKRTTTNGGTRLLARWICSPSISLPEINSRQSLVAFFHARPHLRADLSDLLSELEDSTRIVQKLLLGRGDHTDLTAISTSVDVWLAIKRRLALEREMEGRERGAVVDAEWASLEVLMAKVTDLGALSKRIRAALSRSGTAAQVSEGEDGQAGDEHAGHEQAEPASDEAFPAVSNNKTFLTSFDWTVRPEFSEQLMRLHSELADCLSRRERLEADLQLTYSAPSLTLRSSPGHGMHVHIGRTKRDSAKIRSEPTFIPISESATTSSFFYQEWSQLGAQIIQIVYDIQVAEREAFELLREEVNVHENDIRRNARIMDELDVTIAFANLAHEMHFVRPTLTEDKSYHVVNGRHPTVELGLLASGRTFVPNTVSFAPDSPLHIITGPNMAGKSTLLRQAALIAILAQTGSFVPAEAAHLGVVDAIFSRIGANDDLFRGRSTFMVEMMETADILRRATPNSLVIMDEVGRGTSVQDGLAIAFATIHHLVTKNKSRTLFATHFHELADLLGCADQERGTGAFEGVRFFYTDVDETEDGYFTYSHRLKPGVNRDSHGLKVAQLAGLPESAVGVAQAALSSFRDARTGMLLQNSSALRALGQSLTQA